MADKLAPDATVSARPILRTGHDAKYPWPVDCLLQGGKACSVTVHGEARTAPAFVEVYPRNPATLIGGKGATVSEAEDAAWAQYQRIVSCRGHEFEPRGFRNGAGFCRHCSMFASGVFTAAELQSWCHSCGAPTLWRYDAETGSTWCELHDPNRADNERRRIEIEAAMQIPDADMAAAIGQVLTRLGSADTENAQPPPS